MAAAGGIVVRTMLAVVGPPYNQVIASVPAGPATYLFTDLVGSTRLWEQHPDEMHEALAGHDSIMRSTFERFGGEIFSIAGDSFGVAFDTPQAAVESAVSIQRALASEEWPEGIEIRPRMGLHLGPSSRRSGNYFGSDVNRAARLMSVAHGGQIVVSEVVRHAVIDHPLIDHGEHLLKDLSAPERVYEVETGLWDEPFPPLRTLDRHRVHLPVQPGSFLGREADAAAAVERLKCTRLLTIRGLGGIGKTRLSLHLGAELADAHPDGVHFVELARVTEGDAVGYALSDALGTRVPAGVSPLDAAIAEIGDSRCLLILDNCEHVIDTVRSLVGALLQACPGLRIITTSRLALHLAGEVIFGLAPLATESVDSSAVALFVERATAANPTLEIDSTRLESIAGLCARLDGVPLAIELAAARCRSMTPEDIAALIADRFALLRSRDGAVERHRSLLRTLEWSYDQLDTDSQALLRRLSVFAGPATLASISDVCGVGASGMSHLLDPLETLVDSSMVIADVSGPTTRYRMLETIREFGAGLLGDDAAELRSHHARYFADVVGRTTLETLGSSEGEARRHLTAIWDDLRAAVAHLRVSGDADVAARLVGDLAYEVLWRQRIEGSAWADFVRVMPGFGDLAATERAAVMVTAACGKLSDDSAAEAGSLIGAAMRLIERIDPADFTPGILASTSVYFFLGDLSAGIAANDRLLDRLGDGFPKYRKVLHTSNSSMYGYAGDHDAALEHVERAHAADDPDVAPTWDVLARWSASRFGGAPSDVQMTDLDEVIGELLAVENEFIAAAARRYQVALGREREESLRSIAAELRAVDLADERYATGWMLAAAAELLAAGDEESIRTAIELIGWQEEHRLAPVRPELQSRLDALLPAARERVGADVVVHLGARGARRDLAGAALIAADAADRAAGWLAEAAHG